MPSTRVAGIPCWMVPFSAGTSWLATLLYLIISWAAKGSHRYQGMYAKQEWPYVSNTGATFWGRPFFIAGALVTVLLFLASNVLERWLRYKGRLVHHSSFWMRFASSSAIVLSTIGSIALVLLTIFDIRTRPRIHYPLVAIFLFAYLFASISTSLERKLLCNAYPTDARLTFSLRIRLVFVVLEILLVCLFAATMYQRIWGPSVILEWTVAVLFTFYIWTFTIDFHIVPRRSRKIRRIVRDWQREAEWDRDLEAAGGNVTRPTRVRFASRDYIELP